MLFHHRARLLLGASALAALGLPGGALSNTLDVLATVPEACTVVGGSLDFGEYTPGQGFDKSGSGTFDVDCTVPANVDIALDSGEHLGQAGDAFRAMSNTSGTDFLSYKLLVPGGSTEWGDNATYPAGLPQNFPLDADTNIIAVDGLIGSGQTPVGGSYSDVVTITLIFNPGP